jgi:hypothetical protein
VSRYEVTYGENFLAAARAIYPESRSLEYSGPTFHEFMALPVRAVRLMFGREWETLPSEVGSPVRTVILPPSGVFGPIVFFGILVARSTGSVVEITGFEAHRDYWEQFDDPDAAED